MNDLLIFITGFVVGGVSLVCSVALWITWMELKGKGQSEKVRPYTWNESFFPKTDKPKAKDRPKPL